MRIKVKRSRRATTARSTQTSLRPVHRGSERSSEARPRRMALMSRLDVMQHALDAQRKDEQRKESEALHQLKWHR